MENPTNLQTTTQEQPVQVNEISPSRKAIDAEEKANKIEELERSAVTIDDEVSQEESPDVDKSAPESTESLPASDKISPASQSKKRRLLQITDDVQDADNAVPVESCKSSKRAKLNNGEMVEKKSQSSSADPKIS